MTAATTPNLNETGRRLRSCTPQATRLSARRTVAFVTSQSPPPPEEFGVEFLEWLRHTTEAAWAGLVHEPTVADWGARWRPGTLWTGGLDDSAILAVERRYEVRFPPDHRLFLQTLHSTTPWRRGGRYADGDEEIEYETPGFYDWLRDEPQIRVAMYNVTSAMGQLPFDGQAWQSTWLEENPKPRLLPIFGHRYVVSDDTQWVLSIVDHDAIVYGDDLRDYLLTELGPLVSGSN